MALPLGLNRSRSAIAFVVAEATPGVIDTSRTNSLPDKPGTADAFGLVSVPVIGQQGNYSDTSESGPELIKSFDSQNLIDELYLYTAQIDLPESELKNPLILADNWILKNTSVLGDDELQVFERKELCLQE